VSSLSITFQTLQQSELVTFVVTGYREFVCYSEFPWQIISGLPVRAQSATRTSTFSFIPRPEPGSDAKACRLARKEPTALAG
jgi:hypothetical protein